MPNPKANLDEVFTKIQPFLQVGYSFHKACVMALVPYSTVYPYFCDAYPTYDQAFHDKCERERNLVNIVARQNIIQAIKGVKDEKNNIITLQQAKSFKFVRFSAALDTAYSASSPDRHFSRCSRANKSLFRGSPALRRSTQIANPLEIKLQGNSRPVTVIPTVATEQDNPTFNHSRQVTIRL